MTPEDLAARYPRLYHLTLPSLWPSIERHGLLSTTVMLDGMGLDPSVRAAIERTCRPAAVPLDHPRLGPIVINDQTPMRERSLAGCLDDGLTSADWLIHLNRRVFFWSSEAGLNSLLRARANRTRTVEVLIIDTLRLAQAYATQIEISPINSGATNRKPARRGTGTFTPLGALSYAAWSRQRGGRDSVREVTVLDGVVDIARYVIARRCVLGIHALNLQCIRCRYSELARHSGVVQSIRWTFLPHKRAHLSVSFLPSRTWMYRLSCRVDGVSLHLSLGAADHYAPRKTSADFQDKVLM